jgi:hypothetical protein
MSIAVFPKTSLITIYQSLENVLQNINKLNRSLEGVIAVFWTIVYVLGVHADRLLRLVTSSARWKGCGTILMGEGLTLSQTIANLLPFDLQVTVRECHGQRAGEGGFQGQQGWRRNQRGRMREKHDMDEWSMISPSSNAICTSFHS